MSEKHTPGPWEVDTVPTQVGHAHKIKPINACLYVDHRDRSSTDAKSITAKADAHLIASAPDMHKVLNAINDFWSDAAVNKKSGASLSPSALLLDDGTPIAVAVSAALAKTKGNRR